MDDAGRVSVLDIDDDLAHALGEHERAAASEPTTVVVTSLPTGPWRPEQAFPEPDPGAIGVIVIRGIIAREVRLPTSGQLELLGSGDIVRPWDEDRDDGPIVHYVSWTVVQEAEVALLGRDFAQAIASWPELGDELMCRALRRARVLSLLAAVSHITRVDARVHAALWQLAERWGRVRTDGTHLPLALTHMMLARLVGARRPTVTSALRELSRRELVRREPDGSWMLTGDINATLRARD